jgi:hypothetical protein
MANTLETGDLSAGPADATASPIATTLELQPNTLKIYYKILLSQPPFKIFAFFQLFVSRLLGQLANKQNYQVMPAWIMAHLLIGLTTTS